MPKISFIVTAFERPNALRTCLSSLVQQTERDWEAIVVDNSRDESGWNGVDWVGNERICADLMDKRIIYMNTSPYTGIEDEIHKYSLYKATDMGVNITSAPWLVFPNDDSYYCPWFAERMLHAATSNNWELIYCDLIAGGPGGHWLLSASPRRCCIDKTSFMLARSRYIGFPAATEDYAQADGLMIEQLVRDGIRHGRVDQVLVVHN